MKLQDEAESHWINHRLAQEDQALELTLHWLTIIEVFTVSGLLSDLGTVKWARLNCLDGRILCMTADNAFSLSLSLSPLSLSLFGHPAVELSVLNIQDSSHRFSLSLVCLFSLIHLLSWFLICATCSSSLCFLYMAIPAVCLILLWQADCSLVAQFVWICMNDIYSWPRP